MKRIVVTMLALAVSIGLSQIASAKDAPKKSKGGGIFAKLDTNGDDKLSLEEFTAGKTDKALEAAKKRFAKLDADGDGSVTKEEMKAAHANKEAGGKKKS